MNIADVFHCTGAKTCKARCVDPESNRRLIRSMFNMLIYVVVFIPATWEFLP